MQKFSTQIFDSYFIPAKVNSNKLMIVLHGKGDSLTPFKEFDQELKTQNINYLLLNASKKYDDGYSWYGEPPYQAEGVLRARHKMLALMAELEAAGWLPENIFLLGFSQGCLVSADLALNYPKSLAGVIGVSGYFHFFPRWKKAMGLNSKTPWLFLHGRKDDILPIDDTKFGVEKLLSAGLKVDWVESNKKHTFEPEDYVEIQKWMRRQLYKQTPTKRVDRTNHQSLYFK